MTLIVEEEVSVLPGCMSAVLPTVFVVAAIAILLWKLLW